MCRMRGAVAAVLMGMLVIAPAAVAGTEPVPPAWAKQFLRARNLCLAGQLGDSERVYLELISTLKQDSGPITLIASAYDELAAVLKIGGRFEEAEKHYLRALDLLVRENGRTGERVGILLAHIGAFYVESSQLARAKQYLYESRDILAGLPSVPLYAKASVLQNIAALHFAKHEINEGVSTFHECVELLRTGGRDELPQLAVALGNLALVFASTGRAAEARPLTAEATSIFEAMPGLYLSSYYTLMIIDAGVQRSSGQGQQAADTCDRALPLGVRVLGEYNPKLAQGLDVCSGVFRDQHRGKEAKQLLKRAGVLRAGMRLSPAHQTVDISALH
jgi:tetratricopeptide (TPR) repeat protein